jgi:hypothetical protein
MLKMSVTKRVSFGQVFSHFWALAFEGLENLLNKLGLSRAWALLIE